MRCVRFANLPRHGVKRMAEFTTTQRPRIAVAMTTFDAERFLRAELESIAAQTRLPDCVVVSDDASTDRTLRILDDFSRTAPFPVHVHPQWKHQGVHANTGIVLAAAGEWGDVIIPCDDDDLWQPEKLAAVQASFSRCDSLALWCSDAEWIDSEDRRLGVLMSDLVHLDAGVLERGGGLARLLHGQTLSGGTMAFRSDVAAVSVPIPDETDSRGPIFDQDAWIAVMGRLLGEIALDERRLLLYRRYPGQLSDSSARRSVALDRVATIDRYRRAAVLAAERVRAHPDAAWDPRQVAVLFEIESLFEARAAPRGTPGRWQTVVRQVRSGAYKRHTRGALTALTDLIRAGDKSRRHRP